MALVYLQPPQIEIPILSYQRRYCIAKCILYSNLLHRMDQDFLECSIIEVICRPLIIMFTKTTVKFEKALLEKFWEKQRHLLHRIKSPFLTGDSHDTYLKW